MTIGAFTWDIKTVVQCVAGPVPCINTVDNKGAGVLLILLSLISVSGYGPFTRCYRYLM